MPNFKSYLSCLRLRSCKLIAAFGRVLLVAGNLQSSARSLARTKANWTVLTVIFSGASSSMADFRKVLKKTKNWSKLLSSNFWGFKSFPKVSKSFQMFKPIFDVRLYNVILLGIGFLLLLASFGTLSSAMTVMVRSINKEFDIDWNATTALSIIFVVISFANFAGKLSKV